MANNKKKSTQLNQEKSTSQKLIDDLTRDLTTRIITPDQTIKALINPSYTQFVSSTDGDKNIVKVKFDNGLNKVYELSKVRDIFQNAIMPLVISRLVNLKLLYVKEYGINKELPEGASYSDVLDIKNVIEHDVARYINENGMTESKDEIRKAIIEKHIVEAFSDIYLILNAYSKTFENSVDSNEVKSYKNRMIDFSIKTLKECNEIDKDMSFMAMSSLLGKKTAAMKHLTDRRGIKPLSDNEVIAFIENYINRGEFEYFVRQFGDCILDRRNVVEYFTSPENATHDHSKAGMMDYDEFKRIVNVYTLDKLYKYSHDNELLQYMIPEQIVELYLENEVEAADVKDKITVLDILESAVSNKSKVKILLRLSRADIIQGEESEKIWKLYEEGDFSVEDIKQMESAKLFNIDTIIKQYIEGKNRLIAEELGELPKISDEKIYKYFTPDIVIKSQRNNMNESLLDFYRQALDSIYEVQGDNKELALANELKNNKCIDADKIVREAFELYKNNIVSIDIFDKLDISNEKIIDYCRAHIEDEQLLIDMFNKNLISEIDMFENVLDMDFDFACKLIRNGMSSRAIKGLETTSELIQLTRSNYDRFGNEHEPILKFEHLIDIKDDIVTGIDENGKTQKTKNGASTLLDLYLKDKLSYSELYELAEAGVISIDIANEINEKYNLRKDWETLKEEGVKGRPLEALLLPEVTDTELSSSFSYKGPVGIDEDCIIDLYLALGAKEYLEIDKKECPVFKDYIIIPVMEKKVAYLEGKDGRTYIVPLKIVLEQINNPKGDMDLIGNAPSRRTFNNQKSHIRSANHTRNWGMKVALKTAELPSVPMTKEEAKIFIKDNQSIIKAIEDSYDNRKYSMDKSQNE